MLHQILNFLLERLSSGDHFPEWRQARSSCIWCKYLTKKVQKKAERDPPISNILYKM
jgi:hypothetical protein